MKMKFAKVAVVAVLCLVSCERPVDPALERGRSKILKEAIEERDRLEKRVDELEKENMILQTSLDITANRLELAKDSSELYGRLLEDSNEAKLQRARDLLRQAEGR